MGFFFLQLSSCIPSVTKNNDLDIAPFLLVHSGCPSNRKHNCVHFPSSFYIHPSPLAASSGSSITRCTSRWCNDLLCTGEGGKRSFSASGDGLTVPCVGCFLKWCYSDCVGTQQIITVPSLYFHTANQNLNSLSARNNDWMGQLLVSILLCWVCISH